MATSLINSGGIDCLSCMYCPCSGKKLQNSRQIHSFEATKMANPKFWGITKFPNQWWPKKGGADAPPAPP